MKYVFIISRAYSNFLRMFGETTIQLVSFGWIVLTCISCLYLLLCSVQSPETCILYKSEAVERWYCKDWSTGTRSSNWTVFDHERLWEGEAGKWHDACCLLCSVCNCILCLELFLFCLYHLIVRLSEL